MSDPRRSPAPNRPEQLRVAFAAGGTGGHLMPAMATAEALARRTECRFLVIGSPRANERALRSLVPYPVVEVRSRAIVGRRLLGKAHAIIGMPLAVAVAVKHLRRFRPHLVIATGGYVCGPTGIAARLLRIPLLVLEQNALPGLTTRALRPLADAIAVSFPETARRLGRKAVITGNPVRAALPVAPRDSASERHIPETRAVRLLILGGSQGAHGLNTMVHLAIPILAEADVALKVIHQTGQRDIEILRTAWQRHGIPATVTPFIQNVGRAYAQADLVCARAGATTVAELGYCGLPAVLVPFPGAGGHQRANAAAYARAGAAVVVEETANGRPLGEVLIELATDRDRLAQMAHAAAGAGWPDAADAVASLALGLAGRLRHGHRPNPSTQEPAPLAPDRVLRTPETH